MTGESLDGFSTTALPVTIAAAVIPAMIANAKFHGGMTTPTPSGMYSSRFSSPAMGVNGGPENPRLSAGSSLAPKIKFVEQNMKASSETLEEDWLSMSDEFGFVPKGDARLKSPKVLKVDELAKYMGAKEDVKPERAAGELDEDEEGEGSEDGEESSAEES